MTRVRVQKRGHKVLRDRGHYARKTVYYAACVLLTPVAMLAVAARAYDDLLAFHVGARMAVLRAWSHPCLYKPGPEKCEHKQ